LTVLTLIAVVLFLAYSNGANDNFKGVATLYGSGVLNYKTALSIATAATFLGSICALFLAQGLVASFSGKGLVPQDIAGATTFLTAVGIGAGSTVLLATRLGFPISTTHSLVGDLLGAGVMAVGMDVNFYRLGGTFIVPLLASPFIAFILGGTLYGLFTQVRKTFGFTKESCICIGEQKRFVPISSLANRQSNSYPPGEPFVEDRPPTWLIADNSDCALLYTGRVLGISLQKVLDSAHVVSGAAVSFARGLNDTPKIAGLLVAVHAFDIRIGLVAIAIGIALGGLFSTRRVAETMSK